jgi:hypothetical protein
VNKYFFIFFLASNFIFAQSDKSFWRDSDSTNKSRILGSSLIMGTIYAGSITYLQQVWYKESYQKNFHFFNDGKNWLQMDKVGHGYTSYYLSEKIARTYRWSGLSINESNLIGMSLGISYLTTLEILDGFSKDWGFSLWDMGANITGSALFIGQEYAFSKQIFIPKFSFHRTKFAELRPAVLGSNFTEQLLKDYNGQTYWLSFSPGNLGWKSFPKWLCLSFGYSIDEKLVGNSEIYQNYYAKREYLFSLDLNLNELEVKNEFLKKVLRQFNMIKVPFPAIYLKDSKIGVNPIYF